MWLNGAGDPTSTTDVAFQNRILLADTLFENNTSPGRYVSNILLI